jgi:hypothetical protein
VCAQRGVVQRVCCARVCCAPCCCCMPDCEVSVQFGRMQACAGGGVVRGNREAHSTAPHTAPAFAKKIRDGPVRGLFYPIGGPRNTGQAEEGRHPQQPARTQGPKALSGLVRRSSQLNGPLRCRWRGSAICGGRDRRPAPLEPASCAEPPLNPTHPRTGWMRRRLTLPSGSSSAHSAARSR